MMDDEHEIRDSGEPHENGRDIGDTPSGEYGPPIVGNRAGASRSGSVRSRDLLERLHAVETRIEGVSVSLRDIKWIAGILIIVFLSLQLWRVDKHNKLESAKDDIGAVLVDMLVGEIDNVINASLLSSTFGETQAEVKRLERLCGHVGEMEPPALEFKYVRSLVDVLKAIHIDDDNEQAERLLRQMTVRTGV